MVKKRKGVSARETGFTLIEIVMVLVLLGILAAVAVPKYFDMEEEAEKHASLAIIAEAQARLNGHFADLVLKGVSCANAVNELKELSAISDSVNAEGAVFGDFLLKPVVLDTDENGTLVDVKRLGSEVFHSGLGRLMLPTCQGYQSINDVPISDNALLVVSMLSISFGVANGVAQDTGGWQSLIYNMTEGSQINSRTPEGQRITQALLPHYPFLASNPDWMVEKLSDGTMRVAVVDAANPGFGKVGEFQGNPLTSGTYTDRTVRIEYSPENERFIIH